MYSSYTLNNKGEETMVERRESTLGVNNKYIGYFPQTDYSTSDFVGNSQETKFLLQISVFHFAEPGAA